MDVGRHRYRLIARRLLLILLSDNSYKECADNNKMMNDSRLVYYGCIFFTQD